MNAPVSPRDWTRNRIYSEDVAESSPLLRYTRVPYDEMETVARKVESNQDDFSETSNARGMIIENPDGSLTRAVLADEWKIEQERAKELLAVGRETLEDQRIAQANARNERIMRLINDEEIALITAGMNEYPEFVDDVITLYIKHERIFVICLLLQVILDCFFSVLGLIYHQETIKEMGMVYKRLGTTQAPIVYWTFFCGDLLYSIFYYPIGFRAVMSRSVLFFKWFTSLSLCGLFAQMALAYINKFNLLIFFLRILSYIYARFLSSLIMSLLLLPR